MSVETIGWTAAGLSLLCFAVAQAMYSWDMYWVHRHHARFQMFEVRDRLVRLVATGHVKEADLAWRATYSTVNSLLELQKNHSIWNQLLEFIRHRERMRKDPERRRRVKEIVDAILERAESDPVFADVLRAMDEANAEMCNGQTHWWDRLGMYLLRMVLNIFVLILDPSGRLRNSRKDGAADASPIQDRRRSSDWYRGITRKSPADLVGWRSDRPVAA